MMQDLSWTGADRGASSILGPIPPPDPTKKTKILESSFEAILVFMELLKGACYLKKWHYSILDFRKKKSRIVWSYVCIWIHRLSDDVPKL